MLVRGVPEPIQSDNGAEMTAAVVRNCLTRFVAAISVPPIRKAVRSNLLETLCNPPMTFREPHRLLSSAPFQRSSVKCRTLRRNRQEIDNAESKNSACNFGRGRRDGDGDIDRSCNDDACFGADYGEPGHSEKDRPSVRKMPHGAAGTE
jgi:hypothetical protein